MNTIAIGIVIVLVFIWRFVRTRQLYLTSLRAHASENPIPFKPHDLRDFIQQTLLGHRSIEPSSFFIRGFVLALVSVCLLPFKGFDPLLYWLVITLIAFYIPWCVVHGILLKSMQ